MKYTVKCPIGLPRRVAAPGETVGEDEVGEGLARLLEIGALEELSEDADEKPARRAR